MLLTKLYNITHRVNCDGIIGIAKLHVGVPWMDVCKLTLHLKQVSTCDAIHAVSLLLKQVCDRALCMCVCCDVC